MEFANTKDLNRRIAKNLAISSFALIAILLLRVVRVLNLDSKVIMTISTLGILTTLSPIILSYLKVNDTFLKYYMFFILELTIGALGCSNKIGIFLTFIVVPLSSCLYFDKKFTLISSIYSYIVMCVAVYINSAGKLEVKFYHWTHAKTFIAYISGFTIEYIVVMLFIFQFLNRAIYVLKNEKDSSMRAKSQELRYELLRQETSDVIFEYFIKEEKYEANKSIYSNSDYRNISFDLNDIENIRDKHPAVALLKEHILSNLGQKKVEPFEIDLSYKQDDELVPLWFSCECFVIHDNGEAVSVIGKLHDITAVKLAQERLRKQRLAQLSSTTQDKKNSIYKLLEEECTKLSEKELDELAEGHQFFTGIFDKLKYSDNLSATINEVLGDLGEYFGVNRIVVIESDEESGSCHVRYQWNSQGEMAYPFELPSLGREALEKSHKTYDTYGYLEFNTKYNIITSKDNKDSEFGKLSLEALLGNQILIPTLSGGKYNGAIAFDRYETKPYSIVEKLLYSDAVNTLSAYINKVNAEAANEAKSAFLSTMSHEIRTPMNAIVGMTEIALRDEDMSPSLRKNVATVQSAAFGLLALINDILDFSKIEAGKIDIVPEKFHVLSLLNDVYEIAKARNNGKLDITVEVDDNVPSVLYGDAVRLKQVMLNFCTNAIKYTDSGFMKMRLSAVKDSEQGCLLSFSVEDSGMGIKKEDLGRLFKSYGQVDVENNHHKEGTGLGLAISKKLIELMDGSVGVESEYQKGSRFFFFVPLSIVDASPAGRFEDYEAGTGIPASGFVSFTAPGTRVLIVDDTKVNLVVEASLLSPMQLDIDEANSGEEALMLINENKYDLILMDYYMPGMDGIETSRRIRALAGNVNRDIPIIALTADASSGIKENLVGAGLNDFITKPLVMPSVYSVLRKWIPREKIIE
ncbi:MAG: ATP-binding protein [Lachnospiraceae bacterium]|nr:ATP-binding protein [Lachnospiraceae bacterium]